MIPILGQPFEVILQEVFAVAYCNCVPDRAERTVLMLMQARPVFCGKCQTGYVLTGMAANGGLNVQTVKQAGTVV